VIYKHIQTVLSPGGRQKIDDLDAFAEGFDHLIEPLTAWAKARDARKESADLLHPYEGSSEVPEDIRLVADGKEAE
jgi:hypothetical protein